LVTPGTILRWHPSTLTSASNLAADLSALGQHQRAHDLGADTLDRRRRILGDDHPKTLTSANNLAADLRALGQHQQAHDLDPDTLDRRRRVLGDDHPNTLTSANNLAADLRALGPAPERADVVVDGAPAVPHDPATELVVAEQP
jgi:hypothetical protein